MLNLDTLYWALFGLLGVYVIIYLIAIVSAVIVFFSAEYWTVDETDPISQKSKRGVIRKMGQMDIVVVGRGDDPRFPVIAQTPRRLSVKGLQEGPSGMARDAHDEWQVMHVPQGVYHHTIQSRFGILSPLYVFRKLTHQLTGRHVVRVFAPLFLYGFPILEPILMEFTRARPRALNTSTASRTSLRVIDDLGGRGAYQMVLDITDHLLEEFPLRFITETLPTKDGFSIRVDMTLVLQVENVAKLAAWRSWSSQVISVASDGIGKVLRPGSVNDVYAASGAGRVTVLQTSVHDHLNNVGGGVMPMIGSASLLDALGLKLRQVTLNDLIPADDATENEIKRIMSITIEAQNRANKIRMETAATVDGLAGATPEQLRHIAAMKAADRAGSIQFIEGGAGGGVVNIAELIAALNQSRGPGSNTGGTP